jgi:predicted RNA binding protein YcfA (HicA-like mRNA interferase family)
MPITASCYSSGVGKQDKTFEQVLSGRSDANVSFSDLCSLLLALGFAKRTRSSHHIFTRDGVEELINLQSDGKDAKPYQVKQVRLAIIRYDLELP